MNNSATSNNMKLVHWPLMCGLLHLVQRGEDRTRALQLLYIILSTVKKW